MAKIYLSLGSNVGDRRKFINLAIDSISGFCKILKISSFYETRPWGKPDQPDFLNLCLSAETNLEPKQLLLSLKGIENSLGRTKSARWAEREIDIDVLFYDNLIVEDSELILPHPRIEERAFVLIPLNEIATDFVHPVLNKSIGGMAEAIGGKEVVKLPKIMGILNITPDSFSDGGELNDDSSLRQKIREMLEAGANIIDIGGESTRPGHQKIAATEETRRILPAIKMVKEMSPYTPVSVDTRKATVAEEALKAGADIINDVSAFGDDTMPEVIKRYDCQVILMRNRPLDGKNLIGSCKEQFAQILDSCRKQNISEDKIILDPGLGFGDLSSGDFSALPGGDPSANTRLVLSVNDYSLGLPVLIGVSRKRFLGTMSGQTNANRRLSESLVFAVMAKNSGASIVRVHDVPETTQALQGI